MQFPFRDLTNQYISLSYQDVVQRYAQGTASYFLDGLGNVIGFVPVGSLGQQLVTADQLVFSAGSASWASASLSASYAQYADTASLTIYTQQVVSASWASQSYMAETASLALIGRIAYYAYVAEIAETASLAGSASQAFHSEIADLAYHAVTADWAASASIADHALVADFALGSQVITGSMANEEFDLLFCSQSGGPVPVFQDADHSISYNPALGRLTADHITTTTLTASYIYGSISNAINADTASLANYADFAGSSSYALESTFSDTASLATYADYAGSASYAFSASQAEFAISASWAPMPATSDSASWASSSISASRADSAAIADTASYVGGYNVDGAVSYATNAGNAATADTASFAWNADTASLVATASHLVGEAEISNSIVFNTSQSAPAWRAGQVFWDSNADTLAIHCSDSNVTLQVGQENWLRVIADEFIPNGSAVFIHSAIQEFPCVGLALADGYSDKYSVIGVATEDIASGSVGIITTQGQVHDLDLSAFSPGDELWLSPTQSGSYSNIQPLDPYQKILVGYVLSNGIGTSALQVKSTALPTDSYPFVGMINVPSIATGSVSSSGSIVYIGTGSVNLCTTADGLGKVKNYQLNSASLSVTGSFLDVQYVIATYNSGNPIYSVVTDRTNVDNIQSTLVYSVFMATGGRVSYSGWDTPGILLANKDYLRVQSLRGIERENGYVLGTSGSTAENFITVTEGRAWKGVQIVDLPAVNSTVDRFVLIAHSASVWSGSLITSSIFNRYDNGTNLVTLPTGDFVVNWVYRAVGNNNSTIVQLSDRFGNIPDAVASQPPTPPPELKDTAFLTGRIILRNAATPTNRFVQLDSAYVLTFAPAGITNHNDLNLIQGGTANEYYHLTAAQYAALGVSSSHAVSASNALTASYLLDYAPTISASWASASISSSHAVNSDFALTASYAFTSSYEMEIEISSSWASSSISASYAATASNLEGFNYINTGSWISILNTDTPVIQVETGSYDAAFFDYVALSGSNTRAGMVFGSWVNGQINYTEVSNVDIGDTSKVTMSLALSTSIIQLIANVTDTTPWKIKALARYL